MASRNQFYQRWKQTKEYVWKMFLDSRALEFPKACQLIQIMISTAGNTSPLERGYTHFQEKKSCTPRQPWSIVSVGNSEDSPEEAQRVWRWNQKVEQYMLNSTFYASNICVVRSRTLVLLHLFLDFNFHILTDICIWSPYFN